MIDWLNDPSLKNMDPIKKELLIKQSSKTQIVVTFLAILQLMKDGTIQIEQEQPFDDIMITSNVQL